MSKLLHPNRQKILLVSLNRSAGIPICVLSDHRSLELKEDYERLKEESERAAETSTFNYHKQRGIKAEIKQYEEQKSEAERYERTMEERVIASGTVLTVGSSNCHSHIVETVSTRLIH
jgi:hypothetical protein